MLSAQHMFFIWAPDHSPWSLWAKPVLFAHMDLEAQLPTLNPDAPIAPTPPWLPAASEKVALVIDCPGDYSVSIGLMAAVAGYRPVPLFNALPGPAGPPPSPDGISVVPPLAEPAMPIALVEVRPIIRALARGADNLAELKLADDAPPAFMLDSNRRSGVGPLIPNRFDNRSVSFPTDFPSANFLLSKGIRRAILVQMRAGQPQADLAHTLLRWQQGGIHLVAAGMEGDGPIEISVTRPSLFRMLWYRLSLMAGLRPQLGGFGGLIPEPSSSG